MIELRKNGLLYNLFEDIGFNSSVDNACREINISTSLQEDSVFELGDKIELVVDGETEFTGFLEEERASITNDSADVVYSGRDLLADLVDSSVPDSVKVTEKKVNFKNLCEKVISAIGLDIEVINNFGTIEPFTNEEITAVGFGGNCMDFLQNFARKRSVFIKSDEKGNMILFGVPIETEYEKLDNNSLLSREYVRSNNKRFNKIRVGSQDNASATEIPGYSDGVNRSEVAIDSEIRETRYLEIEAEETMKPSELKKRAEEEVNIRRARAFSYSCNVPSHGYKEGKLIQVEDSISKIFGTFLIRSVEKYQNSSTGEESRLILCFPESYTGVAERTTTRKSKMGN